MSLLHRVLGFLPLKTAAGALAVTAAKSAGTFAVTHRSFLVLSPTKRYALALERFGLKFAVLFQEDLHFTFRLFEFLAA